MSRVWRVGGGGASCSATRLRSTRWRERERGIKDMCCGEEER